MPNQSAKLCVGVFSSNLAPNKLNKISRQLLLVVALLLAGFVTNGYCHQPDGEVHDDCGEENAAVILKIPVDGILSSHFGEHRRNHHHKGIDIAAPRGTLIGAAAAGTIVFAGWQHGYGNTIIIEHRDGRRTRYAHANTLEVCVGDYVEAGQTIATVGSTGRSTGAHCHFEVISETGEQINPLQVLSNELAVAPPTLEPPSETPAMAVSPMAAPSTEALPLEMPLTDETAASYNTDLE